MSTAAATRWAMTGTGFEYCNCAPGCGCNFAGFPTSKDGSCRAFVGLEIATGRGGDVDLAGVKCAAIIDWPKAIHDGNGKCVFVVDPATTDKQIEVMAQIFTGKLGGMPWEILGTTYQVVGLVKTPITIEGEGLKRTFRADGVGEGRGDTLKNPVTGEEHFANIDLPDGFIWKKGECGQGTFHVSANGVSISAENSNWILYQFDWSNA
jgi:hypothetical protein